MRPVFKTLGKYCNDIIEDKSVVITSYTETINGNPNSTVKSDGFYYSKNIENASITYYTPYVKTTIRAVEFSSYKSDIYPKSWVLEGSNNGQSFKELFVSREPICENFTVHVDLQNKEYCTKSVTTRYSFDNDIAYSFYRIKMIGQSSGTQSDHIHLFIFSHIELYGSLGFPFLVITCKTHLKNNNFLLSLVCLLISN